jgi:uncharacterized phage-associated protein
MMHNPLPAPLASSAADVAKYLLTKSPGGMSQLKLQKLLYFCQAGSLAWTGSPMFNDEIEAWINGPVVVNFWNAHHYQGWISEVPEGNELTSPTARTICDSIYARYGDYAAWRLRDLSHEEPPWKDARKGFSDNERANVPIDATLMLRYYRKNWTH